MSVLEYMGHSCFVLHADNGWTAVFDPYAEGSVPGLSLPRLCADAVYASHSHADHNGVQEAEVKKTHVSPFEVRSLLTDHDEEGGRLRGKNQIFILSNASSKIAHFGDLGRMLTEEEEKELSGCDLIMIPCGGYYTIDAKEAGKIIEKLKPKLAVLMHYRTKHSGYEEIASFEEVKEAIPEAVLLEESEVVLGTKEGIIALTAKQ